MKALSSRSLLRSFLPLILTGLLLGLLTSSCASTTQPPDRSSLDGETQPTLQNQTTQTKTPEATTLSQPTSTNTSSELAPVSQPDPEEPSIIPLPHYTISATLNYGGHLLQVDERIDYANASADTLTELVLMVDAIYFPDVFNLNSLAWAGSEAAAAYTWENAILNIQLPQPLAPGEEVSLLLNYSLNLPSPVPNAQVRPIPFGYSSRQTNLVDWYPFIAPYRSGTGWIAHAAGFFGEHLVYDVSDFDISIRLEDTRTDLIVAASSPAQEANGWLNYHMEKARNFAWSVSPEYVVETTQVGQTTLTSYTFAVHAGAGEAVLQTTADSLALFSELFGPYPRTALSVVEADFLDGMEYDGLYFLSNGFYNLYQGTPGEYLITIAAHETAHMWWYALVGNDQAVEPWLDEALCTYSELLFYERYHPEAQNWWWAYRINYYAPRGWVDGSIYNSAGYLAYRDAVYLNGAVFLDALRKAITPETFTRFLNAYASQYAYQIVSTNDFFMLLKEYSSEDISGLKSQYFKGNP